MVELSLSKNFASAGKAFIKVAMALITPIYLPIFFAPLATFTADSALIAAA
jgi:hypothetical protein